MRRSFIMKTEPAPNIALPSPRPRRSRLAFHLAIVLIVKIILLTLLWHAFIKPNKVKVDVDTMGSRIAGPTSQNQSVSQAHISTTPGDNK